MFLLLQAFEVRSNVCFPVARRAKDLVTVGAGERTDTLEGNWREIVKKKKIDKSAVQIKLTPPQQV